GSRTQLPPQVPLIEVRAAIRERGSRLLELDTSAIEEALDDIDLLLDVLLDVQGTHVVLDRALQPVGPLDQVFGRPEADLGHELMVLFSSADVGLGAGVFQAAKPLAMEIAVVVPAGREQIVSGPADEKGGPVASDVVREALRVLIEDLPGALAQLMSAFEQLADSPPSRSPLGSTEDQVGEAQVAAEGQLHRPLGVGI